MFTGFTFGFKNSTHKVMTFSLSPLKNQPRAQNRSHYNRGSWTEPPYRSPLLSFRLQLISSDSLLDEVLHSINSLLNSLNPHKPRYSMNIILTILLTLQWKVNLLSSGYLWARNKSFRIGTWTQSTRPISCTLCNDSAIYAAVRLFESSSSARSSPYLSSADGFQTRGYIIREETGNDLWRRRGNGGEKRFDGGFHESLLFEAEIRSVAVGAKIHGGGAAEEAAVVRTETMAFLRLTLTLFRHGSWEKVQDFESKIWKKTFDLKNQRISRILKERHYTNQTEVKRHYTTPLSETWSHPFGIKIRSSHLKPCNSGFHSVTTIVDWSPSIGILQTKQRGSYSWAFYLASSLRFIYWGFLISNLARITSSDFLFQLWLKILSMWLSRAYNIL